MKTLLLTFAFLLFTFPLAFGAVTTDNSVVQEGLNVTSLTISSFAVGASNPYVICSVALDSEGSDRTVSSATFNSIAMGVLSTIDPYANGIKLTTLSIKGQSGTHNIVINFSGLVNVWVGCTSFNGVDQTTPNGTVQTSTDYVSGSITVTVPANGLGYSVIGDLHGDNCLTLTSSGVTQTATFTQSCDPIFNGPGSTGGIAGATFTTTGTPSYGAAWNGYAFQAGMAINPATVTVTARLRKAILQ